MRVFDRLGELVERRWRERNFAAVEFPAVAAAALEEIAPARSARYDEVVDELFFGRCPAQREDGSFGQPPVVVYRSERFYIEVICWLDGTTSIHDHAFAGAFHLLSGASLHSEYSFRPRRALHDDLTLGDLVFRGAELLHAGATRAILPGGGFIHALFHLDRPSVSVVVRTWGDPREPQHDYLKPSLRLRASVPAAQRRLAERRRALLHVKASTDAPGYERLLARIVAESDVVTLYDALEDFCLRSPEAPAALAEHPFLLGARTRLGDDVLTELLACLEEGRWSADLVARRAEVQLPEHRAFLAMLLNLPDRARILEAAAAYAAAEGASTVDRWLHELTRSDAPGSVRLLDVELGSDSLPAGVTMTALLHGTIGLMALGVTGGALVRRLAQVLGVDETGAFAEDVLALEPFLRRSAFRALLV